VQDEATAQRVEAGPWDDEGNCRRRRQTSSKSGSLSINGAKRGQRGRECRRKYGQPLVGLAAAHGVYGVARRLGINYQGLKKRVAAGLNKSGLVQAPRAKFVEMGPVLSIGSASSGTVVEVVGAAGNRLTVRLGNTAGVDVPALMREFWSRAV